MKDYCPQLKEINLLKEFKFFKKIKYRKFDSDKIKMKIM